MITGRPLSRLSRAAILHSIGHAYRGLGETDKAAREAGDSMESELTDAGKRTATSLGEILAAGALPSTSFLIHPDTPPPSAALPAPEQPVRASSAAAIPENRSTDRREIFIAEDLL